MKSKNGFDMFINIILLMMNLYFKGYEVKIMNI